MANWVQKMGVCCPIPPVRTLSGLYLVDAIDLEKSFKPTQQLKSYIKYAKTQESECRAYGNNLYR